MLPTNDIDGKVEPCSFQETHRDIASCIADGTFKLKLGLVTRLNRCNDFVISSLLIIHCKLVLKIPVGTY